MTVRDYDALFLKDGTTDRALLHLSLIKLAREGNLTAKEVLEKTLQETLEIIDKVAPEALVEDEFVLPSTTKLRPSEQEISNKGRILLDLIQQGYPVPDFTILTAKAYNLTAKQREAKIRQVIRNMEELTGQKFGNTHDPLLLALRFAMPRYIPGVMPTYLNVGVTDKLYPALIEEYGEEAAARIILNNLKTLYAALEPVDYEVSFKPRFQPDLDLATNQVLSRDLRAAIVLKDARLLEDPMYQVLFFVEKGYGYYVDHLDLLNNFMDGGTHYPTILFQKMVCSALDDASYAGVIYSRQPKHGEGLRLQHARGIFGE